MPRWKELMDSHVPNTTTTKQIAAPSKELVIRIQRALLGFA